jgi:hypothetical protein
MQQQIKISLLKIPFVYGERLKLITEELNGVEQDVQSFKKSNNLTDIDSEAAFLLKVPASMIKRGGD